MRNLNKDHRFSIGERSGLCGGNCEDVALLFVLAHCTIVVQNSRQLTEEVRY